MKNPSKKVKKQILYAVMVFAVLFESCSKLIPVSNSNALVNTSVKSYLSSLTSIQIFNSALKRLQLDTLGVKTGNNYTYFIPTDSAMVKAGLTQDSINKMPLPVLDSLISYHILPGTIISKSLTLFNLENAFNTISIDSIAKVYVEINKFGFFINGVSVLKADIELSNGIINTISKVLTPPRDSLIQTLAIYPELSWLYLSIINNVYFNNYSSDGEIRPFFNGSITLLAPTNNAIAASRLSNGPDRGKITFNTPILSFLLPSLGNHYDSYTSNNLFFSSDFKGNFIWPSSVNNFGVTDLNGNTTTSYINLVFSTDGTAYKSNNMEYFEPFVKKDIITYNGVIHIINTLPY